MVPPRSVATLRCRKEGRCGWNPFTVRNQPALPAIVCSVSACTRNPRTPVGCKRQAGRRRSSECHVKNSAENATRKRRWLPKRPAVARLVC